MVNLDGVWDYAWLLALVAALGAVGGLAAELLQSRSGAIEMPHRGRGHHKDWGVWASVLIGSVAAVASLWFVPPTTESTVEVDGKVVTKETFDLFKVVGLALIVGSAGSSFLTALQARALAQVKSQEAEVTRNVASKQLEAIKEEIEAGSDAATVQTSLATAQAAISATGNPTLEDF